MRHAGRRKALLLLLLLVALALAIGVAIPPVRAATGFGNLKGEAVFGVRLRFTATWTGPAPDRIEILLRYGTDAETFVSEVPLVSGTVRYERDLSNAYLFPNTPVHAQWRAIDALHQTLSPILTVVYDDDRPGLDWHSARIGSATVHWYGGSETQARRFGDLAAGAADRASRLLGHALDGPVDIFVYETRDDFFGVLSSAEREWTGAATIPQLRTILMWLGAGSSSFLDVTLAHEVTHVVFHDATVNPYHDPASWLNEGFAKWSERGNADASHDLVASEAQSSEGLFAFEAITGAFPIGRRGSQLAYAEGATMVDLIIDRFGSDAMAAIAEAYRAGATDDEAIQAGTGLPADEVEARYFASFGVEPPAAIEPDPLLSADVPIPPQASTQPLPGAGSPLPSASASPAPGSGAQEQVLWVIMAIVVLVVPLLALFAFRRRLLR